MQMKNFSRRNRSEVISSFTLIELLVVIAIISILMAMLLPALKKARGMARQIECLNTMKQCGTASTYYLNDFGYLPPNHLGPQYSEYFWWCKDILSLDYLPHPKPKFSTTSSYNSNYIGDTGLDGNFNRLYCCPEETEKTGARSINPGIGNFADIVIGVNCTLGSAGKLHGPNFTYPSRLFYIADSYSFYPADPSMTPSVYTLRWGHNNSANVIYVDMHGDSRKPNSMDHGTYRTPFWSGSEKYWSRKGD